ncbi:DUF2971 domain-containing protein [Flavobacterium sp. I3-2]|uniref:DUF2971 domain-containing protein n=1 Tax=Flavobacterium sp. I3-2 TaxID=2748319 RepID=UPI0015AEFDFB|nr:DUF2971 domain-containing protein [Flavobacterium sp. I3-2]
MPIDKPNDNSAPVFYPQMNYSISKYVDLSKFLSLIQTESIFFCRLDKLEDKLEGTFPKNSKEQFKDWYLSILNHLPPDENVDEIKLNDYLNERINLSEKFKQINCISCWNKSISESYALWKIYSNLEQGIMIKSNVERLIKAFENSDEIISLSEIKYINHEIDIIPTGNLNYPIIHKNIAYSYEQEIRLIHQVTMDDGYFHNWNCELNVNGKYLKVDINELIEEIIISPFAPKWFFDIIEDILIKYNLKKTIKYSVLK